MRAFCKGLLLMGALALTSCYSPVIEYKDEPCLTPTSGFDFKLCRAFNVLIDNKKLTIPEGFVTDLASVPRPLWPLFPPQRAGFIAPSIVHDFLYAYPSGYTRIQADAIFYSALVKNDVSKATAWKMWGGVRVFGGDFYNKGKRNG